MASPVTAKYGKEVSETSHMLRHGKLILPDWILAITTIAFVFSAFGNGANDVANAYASEYCSTENGFHLCHG